MKKIPCEVSSGNVFADLVLPNPEVLLAEAEATILSERDFKIFMDAIENPKPPNAALRKAARQYKKMKKEQKIKELCAELKSILDEGDYFELDMIKEELLKGRCHQCWHKVSEDSQCWNCYESTYEP